MRIVEQQRRPVESVSCALAHLRAAAVSCVFVVCIAIGLQDALAEVDPTCELHEVIARHEKKPGVNSDEVLALARYEARLRELKKQGRTKFHGAAWLKSAEYYQGLDTPALARECFFKSGIEAGVFGTIMRAFAGQELFGLKNLEICHDGFGELLHRKDLLEGILIVQHDMVTAISEATGGRTVVLNSIDLEGLSALVVWPEFKTQLEGREALFLAGALQTLDGFSAFISADGPKRVGLRLPFYTEPCGVARMALALAKKVDPGAYAQIEKQVTKIRFSDEQRLEDVQGFIDTVGRALKPLVSKATTEELLKIIAKGD